VQNMITRTLFGEALGVRRVLASFSLLDYWTLGIAVYLGFGNWDLEIPDYTQ
jgi:hypothetical protein